MRVLGVAVCVLVLGAGVAGRDAGAALKVAGPAEECARAAEERAMALFETRLRSLDWTGRSNVGQKSIVSTGGPEGHASVTAIVLTEVAGEGSWSGTVRFSTAASVDGQTATLTTTRHFAVVDITPPAPHHTLFIHGGGTERLGAGVFTLRNLPLPAWMDAPLRAVLKAAGCTAEAGESASDAVDRVTRRASPGGWQPVLTSTLRRLDNDMKDAVDRNILSANPRRWGRVRTNGTLLVRLPAWAPDDAVNYCGSDPIFNGRAEFGYRGGDNRLHDPYLGVYTHYEGYIYKEYQREAQEGAQVVGPQRYTINTRMNYVQRYPGERPVPQLDALARNAPRVATRTLPDGAVLQGTPGSPLALDGVWYARGNVTVGGAFTGRGVIVATGGIRLAASVTRADADARLGLVALGGPVQLQDTAPYRIDAHVYARDGLRGAWSASARVRGNLAVETLDRAHMPGTFECWFDPTWTEQHAYHARWLAD